MQDVYKNIDEYNIDEERKRSIVLDNMIIDMINNKKLNSIVTELFFRDRKLNISLVLHNHTQSYLKVPKDVTPNTTYIFITKIPNKRELQQNTTEPYSFIVNDATLASDNPSRFRKNLFNV